jgi:hypothetical protein
VKFPIKPNFILCQERHYRILILASPGPVNLEFGVLWRSRAYSMASRRVDVRRDIQNINETDRFGWYPALLTTF